MEINNSPSGKVWKRFRKNKMAFAGLLFILLMVLMGILGYLITPDQTPYANSMHLQLSNKKPGRGFDFLIISRNKNIKKVNFLERMLFGQEADFKSIPVTAYREEGNKVYAREYIGDDEQAEEAVYPLLGKENRYRQTFWLGTDIYGRDLLSRLIIGIRVSLSVGLMAVLISLFIGISLGALSGYFGGKIDASISWFMNVIWSLPSLLLVIAISFALGKGFWQIFIAVGLSTWVDVSRLVRGQLLLRKAQQPQRRQQRLTLQFEF
jgi:oligopeptide transport system permease protein